MAALDHPVTRPPAQRESANVARLEALSFGIRWDTPVADVVGVGRGRRPCLSGRQISCRGAASQPTDLTGSGSSARQASCKLADARDDPRRPPARECPSTLTLGRFCALLPKDSELCDFAINSCSDLTNR